MAKATKKMTFRELLQRHPEAAPIIAARGLHCLGCHGALFESIEQGSEMHGLSDKEIDKMVAEINKSITGKAPRPKKSGKAKKAKE